MQRYIVLLHVSITDSKLKSPRLPAGNGSNWHHLYFFFPYTFNLFPSKDNTKSQSENLDTPPCGAAQTMQKKGARSKADITTHAFMLPDNVSLPHQRKPHLLQKGSQGE